MLDYAGVTGPVRVGPSAATLFSKVIVSDHTSDIVDVSVPRAPGSILIALNASLQNISVQTFVAVVYHDESPS